MKKSVFFLIGVICFISIFVITFFGSKASFDQFKVYIQKIEITSYDEIFQNKKYLYVDYSELEGGSTFIDYKVEPTNATNISSVKFILSGDKYIDELEEEHLKAEIDKKGELFFYEPGTVIVKIISTDGLKVHDTVVVICEKDIRQTLEDQ